MTGLIQTLSALSGILTTGTGFIIVIVGWFIMAKSGIGKKTSEAQSGAIIALEAEVSALTRKVDSITKENARLEQTIDTICMALKTRGMLISIQGEMINIEDLKNGKTTVTRIREKEIG